MTLQIVIAEDSVLFREGLMRLLGEAGHEVAAAVGDAESLMLALADGIPDVVIVDVRMPPDMTDDGARAAHALRSLHPNLPILLLSQHIETRHAVELVGAGAFGYLLKDRVLRVDEFVDAVERVAAGGSALDPSVVAALVAPHRRDVRLGSLSARELEVLELGGEEYPGLRALVRDQIQKERPRLILDLDSIERIDSHGVGEFVAAWQHAKNQGGELVLAGLKPRIRDIFEILYLDKVIPIFDTVIEAAVYLARSSDEPPGSTDSG